MRALRCWRYLVVGVGGLIVASCDAGVGAGHISPESEAPYAAEELADPVPGVGAVSEVWRSSAEPDLRLGAVDGTGPETFGSISSAAFLDDGGFVVADGMNLQVRAFDASGAHRWTAGRAGTGPGEFRSLGPVFVRGDSVLAFGHDGRVNVFSASASGELIGTFAVSPSTRDPGWPWVVGVTPEGGLIGRFQMHTQPPVGHHRGAMIVSVHGPGGALLQVLPDTFPAGDYWRLETGMERVAHRSIRRGTHLATGRIGFFVAVQDQPVIRRFTFDGTMESVLRLEASPRPVDREVRRQWVEGPLSAIQDPVLRERVREEREHDPLPPALPAFGRVLVDSEDRLWVEEFSLPGADRSEWWVYSAEGTLLARALLPLQHELEIHEISEHRILGTSAGPMGVPEVKVWPIIREGPS